MRPIGKAVRFCLHLNSTRLGVTIDPLHPTEVPAGDWDVAVFDNRFPSLSPIERGASLSDRAERTGEGPM